MVKAIIDISESTNKTLNAIKVEYDLKTKSEAINKMAELYLSDEPGIRPEYARKLLRTARGPSTYVGTMDDFDRLFPISSRGKRRAQETMAKVAVVAAKRYKK